MTVSIEDMRRDFERTGTLAPMYAREMFGVLNALLDSQITLKAERDAALKLVDDTVATLEGRFGEPIPDLPDPMVSETRKRV